MNDHRKTDPRVAEVILGNGLNLLVAAKLIANALRLSPLSVEPLLAAGMAAAHAYGITIRDDLDSPGHDREFFSSAVFFVSVLGLVNSALKDVEKLTDIRSAGPMSSNAEVAMVWNALKAAFGWEFN